MLYACMVLCRKKNFVLSIKSFVLTYNTNKQTIGTVCESEFFRINAKSYK